MSMLTRDEAKALASDLYSYFIEHGSPTPVTGRPTGWDEVWVNMIVAHYSAHDAVLRQRVEALKQIVKDDVEILKRFDDKLAAVTQSRDEARAACIKMDHSYMTLQAKLQAVEDMIKRVSLQWKPGDGPAACREILARLEVRP